MEPTMNRTIRLYRKNLIEKATALDNLFRLAESIGYPFSGVKLPDIYNIRSEFAAVSGFNSYNDILNLGEDTCIGDKTYGVDHYKASFPIGNFQCEESKQFAIQMFEYIYLENDKGISFILNAMIIRPVNHQITQALIQYDNINNIDADLYVHPYFLIEYYKVAIALERTDYMELGSVRFNNNEYLKPECFDLRYYHYHVSSFFNGNIKNPEHRFDLLTYNFLAHEGFIQYDIKTDVVVFIIQHLGRLNIEKMAKQRTLNRSLINVALNNLKHFKPNLSNDYFKTCARYKNNVNNDDQVITFNHDLFDQYFVSYYGLEFAKAFHQIYAETKPERKMRDDVSIDELTMDMYGRLTLNVGVHDMKKIIFRYLQHAERMSYEQGLAKIHSRIIANNSIGEHASEFLPTQLVAYIKAIYNDLNTLTDTKDILKPYLNFYS